MGLLHSFSWHPRALIAAPAFGIWAAAYAFVKDSSRSVFPAYSIIVAAHRRARLGRHRIRGVTVMDNPWVGPAICSF